MTVSLGRRQTAGVPARGATREGAGGAKLPEHHNEQGAVKRLSETVAVAARGVTSEGAGGASRRSIVTSEERPKVVSVSASELNISAKEAAQRSEPGFTPGDAM